MTVNNEAASPERARIAVSDFLDDRDFKVPVLMDNGSVARAYDVRAVPHYVLIAPDGKVALMHQGGLSEEQLEREIQSVLD